MRKTIDPLDVEIGARLRAMREDNRVSQEKLAEALGISYQQVQKYEKGTDRIAASRAVRICRFFGTSVSALLLSDNEAAAVSSPDRKLVTEKSA